MDPRDRENYYLLLRLSLEKEETDEAVIRAAIKAMAAEWSKRETNSPDARRYRQWFNPAGPGEKAVLDPAQRTSLFQKAAKYVETELPIIVDLRCEEKGFLTKRDIEDIAKLIGIPDEEVRKRLPVLRPHVEINDGKVEVEEKLPKDFELGEFIEWCEILQRAGVGSLYDYRDKDRQDLCLVGKEKSPTGDVASLIDAMLKHLDRNRNKTAEEEAVVQALSKAKQKYFTDDVARKKHDAMDMLTKHFPVLRSAVDKCGATIPEKTFQGIMKLITEIGAPDKLAKAFVWAYAKKTNRSIQRTPAPQVECPKCRDGIKVSITGSCKTCGVKMSDAFRCKSIISGAALAAARGDWVDARQRLDQVVEPLRDLPEYREVASDVEVLRKKDKEAAEKKRLAADKVAAEAQKAYGELRYYKANNALDGLEAIDASHKILILRPKIHAKIKEADSEVARIDKIAATMEQEKEWIRFIKLFPDHPRSSAVPPPRPPGEVKAAVEGLSVTLSWKASPSPEVEGYLILRQADGWPTEQNNDGWKHECDACQAKDAAPPPGQNLHYAVYALRGRKVSVPEHGQPIVILTAKVGDAHAEPGDGKVTLRWKRAQGSKGTRVEKKDKETGTWKHLVDRGEGRESYSDDDLINGHEYNYRLTGIYHDRHAKEVLGAGTEISIIPAEPPEPINDLHASRAGDSAVVLSWSPPPDKASRITILVSSLPSGSREGKVLSKTDAFSLGTPIPITDQGVGQTQYRESFKGRVYFIPITELNGMAAVGRSSVMSSVLPVTDVRVEQAGSKIKIIWKWPSEATCARVLSRSDLAPQGIDDKRASLVGGEDTTRAKYDKSGGLLLDRPTPGSFVHILVLSGVNNDGQTDYGPGVVIRYPSAKISYCTRKQGGFLGIGGHKKFILVMESQEPVPLREMKLVLRKGGRPRSPDDGEVIKIYEPGKRGNPPTILSGTWLDPAPIARRENAFLGLFAAATDEADAVPDIARSNDCQIF